MTSLDAPLGHGFAKRALLFAGILFVVELVVIGSVFKHGLDFYCLDNWPRYACAGASQAMVGIYCILGALVLMLMLRPRPFQELTSEAGGRLWSIGINLAGVLVALVPATFLSNGAATQALPAAFACWTLGMGSMLIGLALFCAPYSKWRLFLSEQWQIMLPVVLVGFLGPFISTTLRPIWNLDTIAGVTFDTVAGLVAVLGYDVFTDHKEKIIGVEGFLIDVAPACSGIEGIALVTLFVSIYLWLFKDDLRFPRAFLLYPIGIAASAVFNVLRIAILLIIGLEGSPELAVGGFHSHAGWLMFTVVALGIIALAQTVPALQKETDDAVPSQVKTEPLPLLKDPIVAAILPFAVFMLSALLTQAFSQNPSLIYPGRVILMAGVLALFWPLYRLLPWRIDPVALGAGAVIGLYWVLIPVEAGDAAAPYGALTGVFLIGWFFLRGLGTVVLVPMIEELFFRSYLETRLRLGSTRLWSVMAAIVTAALFAALHDRILEAFVAGLIFSWVARRNDNITDAIIAHAVANLIVFGVALATGQMHII